MTSVAIIGTGFGGLAAAVRLTQAGIDDLVLFEKAAHRWRVAGEHLSRRRVRRRLAPLLAVVRPEGRLVAPVRTPAEIHQYPRHVARDFDVLRQVRFATEGLAAAFDEADGCWRLTLSGGGEHRADVLIAATGQLSRPSRPAVPGLERFRGTARTSGERARTGT